MANRIFSSFSEDSGAVECSVRVSLSCFVLCSSDKNRRRTKRGRGVLFRCVCADCFLLFLLYQALSFRLRVICYEGKCRERAEKRCRERMIRGRHIKATLILSTISSVYPLLGGCEMTVRHTRRLKKAIRGVVGKERKNARTFRQDRRSRRTRSQGWSGGAHVMDRWWVGSVVTDHRFLTF